MARKRTRALKDDPGVAEVRRWRAKLWKQGGGTLKGVMDMLRAAQDAEEAAGRVVIRKKSAGKTVEKKKRRAA